MKNNETARKATKERKRATAIVNNQRLYKLVKESCIYGERNDNGKIVKVAKLVDRAGNEFTFDELGNTSCKTVAGNDICRLYTYKHDPTDMYCGSHQTGYVHMTVVLDDYYIDDKGKEIGVGDGWGRTDVSTQLHKLIAMVFHADEFEQKLKAYNSWELEVNHKDGCHWHNNADNLEWVTRSENLEHARFLKRMWTIPEISEGQYIALGPRCKYERWLKNGVSAADAAEYNNIIDVIFTKILNGNKYEAEITFSKMLNNKIKADNKPVMYNGKNLSELDEAEYEKFLAEFVD